MSPCGLRLVLIAQFVANLGIQLVVVAFLLTVMMAVSGRRLNVDLVSLLPLVLLTVAGVLGLGLMVGGCALVFKRVQTLIQVLQMGLVALIAAPLKRVPWLRYLPLSWGNQLITRVMVNGQSIFDLPGHSLLFLLAHACVWLAAGLFVFGRFEKAARRRALLGHY
jgi:ABC-2 type transport system permease protein